MSATTILLSRFAINSFSFHFLCSLRFNQVYVWVFVCECVFWCSIMAKEKRKKKCRKNAYLRFCEEKLLLKIEILVRPYEWWHVWFSKWNEKPRNSRTHACSMRLNKNRVHMLIASSWTLHHNSPIYLTAIPRACTTRSRKHTCIVWCLSPSPLTHALSVKKFFNFFPLFSVAHRFKG